MNKIISIIVILVLIGAGFWLFKDKTEAPNIVGEETPSPAPTPTPTTPPAASTIKEFSVEGGSFYFAPKTMTVNVGDTVKITLKNVAGVHDLKIDEFNAATKILSAGESQTITFVANKAGTFEYYCSVGQHRAMGMVGTLTVQ